MKRFIIILFCIALLSPPAAAQGPRIGGNWKDVGGVLKPGAGQGIDLDGSGLDDAQFYEYVFIPVSDMLNGSSPPDTLETISSGNGKVTVRKFDDASDEDLTANWSVPFDIDTTAGISYAVEFIVTEATAMSSEGVSFFLQGYSSGLGDSISGSFGTAVESNKTGRSDPQYDLVRTSWSTTVTVTGLAAGDKAFLNWYRDVSDANDDYAQDVGPTGIWIRYVRETVAP